MNHRLKIIFKLKSITLHYRDNKNTILDHLENYSTTSKNVLDLFATVILYKNSKS